MLKKYKVSFLKYLYCGQAPSYPNYNNNNKIIYLQLLYTTIDLRGVRHVVITILRILTTRTHCV